MNKNLVPEIFKISDQELAEIVRKYPKEGKNSHIAEIALEMAKKYFERKYGKVVEFSESDGIDLVVKHGSKIEFYEVKGTESAKIAFNQLVVSGQPCHDHLKDGKTELMRITKIRNNEMGIYFLKYGEHFKLVPEVRWKVCRNSQG